MKREQLDLDAEPAPDDLLQLDISIDRKRPVSDQIYAALKRAIVTLKLPPGHSISENRICRHIGVSRTPVREAIIRLVEDALIDVYPQQGSFVAPIKVNQIRESHFIRKCLEVSVLAKAAERWSPEASAEARTIIVRQQWALAAEDPERFHGLDEEFHKFFSGAAGLMGVWNTIQGAKARVDRLHRLAAIEGRLPVVVEEHLAIVDALDRADHAGAVAALDYHLDKILSLLDLLIVRHAQYFAE